jgi:N-acyl-D-aspartate/D-glutamate deacylase
MAPKASQGVATVITGNCGVSLAPLPAGDLPPPLDLVANGESGRFRRFADYLDALEARPAAVNAACLVGHSALRVGAMDDLDRPASEGEISTMRRELTAALTRIHIRGCGAPSRASSATTAASSGSFRWRKPYGA